MTGTHPPRSALRAFLAREAAGGVVLIAAAALAMIVANLPATAHDYHALIHAMTGPVLAPALGPMTVHLWIIDALMAVFFLLVGLEIKREFLDGRLSTWERRRLPVIAAGAGMALPALVYLAMTRGAPNLQSGWAIPAATDIAFAIGVLALLGSRAPASLKLFLTTVAIVDDMGAVVIIALAYTDQISSIALGGAALVLGLLYVLGKSGVRALPVYLIGFVLAVVLTAIPFWLVMHQVIDSKAATISIVLILAVVQIFVHIIYFLHLDTRSEGGWNMLTFIFSTVLVVIVLGASIWVLYRENMLMMPGMMSETSQHQPHTSMPMMMPSP